MGNKKNIEINCDKGIHRVTARMPEFAREYGLWIVSGGIGNVTAPDSFCSSGLRVFDFYSLSQMYDGHGKLELNGVVREIEPGNMILICPGEFHRYGGSMNSAYIEDSICFCGNIADAMRKKGMLRSGVYRGSPVRVVKQLVEMARDPSLSSGLRAALGLQELLTDIYDSCGSCNDPMDALLENIRKAPPEHWWRVTELAELIGVSTDTLRREFLRVTGLLPKAYIEQLKLRQAAEMLLTCNLSVSDIALHFGYLDCYHFSRRFKVIFGLSPANYRAAMKSAR